LWRGLTFSDVANQMCSNSLDRAHGRQLPNHTGSARHNVLYVKSTLGTQCPHAAGAAYAMKRQRQQRVSIAYLGEGTTSEGDFPSALNIAAVHGCPTLFFCRNNGYAISTSAKDQYAGDGIAHRGPAYGLPAIRIDGNDVLAVLAATQAARQIALDEGRPVLIEAMTYRSGAHSTSDDDSAYRNPISPVAGWDSERAYWEARSPIVRFGRYMQSRGWWNAQREEHLRRLSRKQAIESLNAASSVPKPHNLEELFSDVFDRMPPFLQQQLAALEQHVHAYPEDYPQVVSANR